MFAPVDREGRCVPAAKRTGRCRRRRLCYAATIDSRPRPRRRRPSASGMPAAAKEPIGMKMTSLKNMPIFGGDTPETVRVAVTLLAGAWCIFSYRVAIFESAIVPALLDRVSGDALRVRIVQMLAAAFIAIALVLALLVVQIARRKNWARLTMIGLVIAMLALMAFTVAHRPADFLSAVYCLCTLATLLLLSRSSRQWFGRPQPDDHA
ncbi:hypothetical protein LGM89_01170 [Burkholderia sp. AU31624]|uniref:hypothetical protein n=1 Tax=Burkholderia sp. AU31624 TaxID=2879629 RepID=UPI001CF4D1BC|nr:hypothetical protein [Burkholderia sp. AU31624]MCA8251863.1 hypothetical protein [Burkholderia sp. AU31624]